MGLMLSECTHSSVIMEQMVEYMGTLRVFSTVCTPISVFFTRMISGVGTIKNPGTSIPGLSSHLKQQNGLSGVISLSNLLTCFQEVNGYLTQAVGQVAED